MLRTPWSTSASSPRTPQTVLAGVGNLTRRGRASDALPYRAAVAERLDLDEVPVGQEERPVITMLDKDVSGRSGTGRWPGAAGCRPRPPAARALRWRAGGRGTLCLLPRRLCAGRSVSRPGPELNVLPTLCASATFFTRRAAQGLNLSARLSTLQGRRIIENSRDIREVLQRRYPAARVQLVDFGKHPNLTMAEQVGAGAAAALWGVWGGRGGGHSRRCRRRCCRAGRAGRPPPPLQCPYSSWPLPLPAPTVPRNPPALHAVVRSSSCRTPTSSSRPAAAWPLCWRSCGQDLQVRRRTPQAGDAGGQCRHSQTVEGAEGCSAHLPRLPTRLASLGCGRCLSSDARPARCPCCACSDRDELLAHPPEPVGDDGAAILRVSTLPRCCTALFAPRLPHRPCYLPSARRCPSLPPSFSPSSDTFDFLFCG